MLGESGRARGIALIVVVMLVALSGGGVARGEEDALDRRRTMPRRFTERPLTLPNDTFGIRGGLGVAALSPSDPAVIVSAGADYGVDDDLQIGLLLLDLVMSPLPGTGLGPPQISLQHRILSGALEVAALASMTVPVGGDFSARIGAPFLLRLGAFARFDLAPTIGVIPSKPFRFPVNVPAALMFALGDAVTIGPTCTFVMPSASRATALLSPGGRVGFSFGDARGVTVELSLSVLAPALRLSGVRPAEPFAAHRPSGLLALTWFLANPNEPTPLSEDF